MSSNLTSSVKIVDGVLILSFPEAETPVVWRMKLEEAALAAFEVRKNSDTDNGFFLHLRASDNKSDNIALFETKEEAVKALMDVTKAMEEASSVPAQPSPAHTNVSMSHSVGPMAVTQSTPAPKRFGLLKTILLALFLSALLILGLLFLLVKSGPSYNEFPSQISETPPQNSIGTPLSADDFLNQR